MNNEFNFDNELLMNSDWHTIMYAGQLNISFVKIHKS